MPEVRRLPAVPDPDGPEAAPDVDCLDPEGPDGPDGPDDPDGAGPGVADAADAGAAARPQTLQYPSSIVPPQLVHVLIVTALPSSAPPSGTPSGQLAYCSDGGFCGGPSQRW